jgi:hypothetical protein
MTGRVDLSVLPEDLARLYAEPEMLHACNIPTQVGISDQLELPVESAAHEFRRWLQAQPQPSFITEAAP